MSKTILAGALVASILVVLPLAACADSGHEDEAESASEGGHHEEDGGHGTSTPQSSSLAGAAIAGIAGIASSGSPLPLAR